VLLKWLATVRVRRQVPGETGNAIINRTTRITPSSPRMVDEAHAGDSGIYWRVQWQMPEF